MGWFSPLTNYCTRRINEQQHAFGVVRKQISSIVNAIDDIVASAADDDSDSQPISMRELQRRLDDLHLSPWATLIAVSRRADRTAVEKCRRELKSRLQLLRESSDPVAQKAHNFWQTQATELFSIRSELGRLQAEAEAVFYRQFQLARKAGAAASGFVVALSVLIGLQSVLEPSIVAPLAPTTGYQLQTDGAWSLGPEMQSQFLDDFSQYLAGSSPDIASLTPVVISAEEEQKPPVISASGDRSGERENGPRQHRDTAYEQVWRLEFTNSSFVRSRFISTIELEVSLEEPSDFPWTEVGNRLPKPEIAPVDLWNMNSERFIAGKIANTGTVPAIVSSSLMVGGRTIAESSDQFLAPGTRSPLRVFREWAVGYLDEQGGLTSDLGWSKSPSEWNDGEWTYPPDTIGLQGMSPKALEERGMETFLPDSEYKLVITIENLQGVRQEKSWTGQLDTVAVYAANVGHFFTRRSDALDNPQLSGPNMPAGFGGVGDSTGDLFDSAAARIVGTPTPIGNEVLTASLHAGQTGSASGSKRFATTVLDQYLCARGRLVCYARFHPATSGTYSLRATVDGAATQEIRIKIDRADPDFRIPTSIREFRDVQQRITGKRDQGPTNNQPRT